MGLLNSDITMLHFDDTYFAQKSLFEHYHEDIFLQNLSQVQYFCGERSLKTIEKRLHSRSQRGITYIGSGNYHYVTYLLMKEIKRPFTLILFDNHTDVELHNRGMNMLSCGSWVSFAIQNIAMLKKVIIIGTTSSIPPIPTTFPISIYPYEKINELIMPILLTQIPTNHTYVSIDKDVLHVSDATTNWDHGKMRLSSLLNFIHQIVDSTQVEGIDICGEVPATPSSTIEERKSLLKNERANLQLLQAFRQSVQKRGA